jgi:RNA polymerase sigma-70 factor (ECF subfamily)
MTTKERTIVTGLRNGHNVSYQYLYDNHYVALCYIAVGYVRDDAVAQMLVDDLFVHIYDIRRTLDITTSIRTYLARAIRNRCLDYLKSSHAKLSVSLTDNHSHITDGDLPSASLLEQELEDEIVTAINSLPPQTKSVFEKSRYQEKTYAEIAQELDISINTVKYHIKSALSLLYGALKHHLLLILIVLQIF